MQLKGLVRFFTFALILICLYQLSFTWFVRSHEKAMEAKASSWVKKFPKADQVYPSNKEEQLLYNDSLNDIQKAYFKKKYIGFINPEFIKFIVDKNDNMIAFAIVMPGFAQALKKANGKLFPFGFLYILREMKKSDSLDLYLTAVRTDLQNKGVNASNTATEKRKGVTHFSLTTLWG
mgnify:CR=1 FL=1